jgi:hypothetical protein
MTLAVMGHHFQVMTRKMSKAMDAAVVQAGEGERVPEEASGEYE